MPLRLIQIQSPSSGRIVAAAVEGSKARRVNGATTVLVLAAAAIAAKSSLGAIVEAAGLGEAVDLEDALDSGWILAPIDHPDSARVFLTGTGLTHLGSADARDKMHAKAHSADASDSMKMFRMGLEGGKPADGTIGVQPEWFYKGNGTILRAHGQPLEVPDYAEDGGEEPEIAGLYLVAEDGTPWRVGFAAGNEFSDHRMESRTYLYLAPSKLRTCSLGPELLVDGPFQDLRGTVTVERAGQPLWSQEVESGEANMVHTLANLEYHHFKYAAHRRPGDAHVHFFGTGGFSYGAGIQLAEGDIMVVAYEGYGRPLRNPIRIAANRPEPLRIGVL